MTHDANFTADSTGVSITRAARRVNGTVNESFTIEVARLDLGKAQIFTGCTVNMFDVTIADEAMVTANLTFEAATSTFQDTDLGTDQFIASATYTDATSHPVLDSLSIPEIRSAGTRPDIMPCKATGTSPPTAAIGVRQRITNPFGISATPR